MDHIDRYLDEVCEIAARIDRAAVDWMIELLAEVRADGGRLFLLGVGGSAGNASHAVNDFRKIAAMEAYTPTDNVSELTARINDDGWETCFANWLRGSRLGRRDAVLVFSVGGGRFARMFVGLTPGWFAGKGGKPSAEQVRDQMGKIRDTAGYIIPDSIADEMKAMLAMFKG